MLNIGNLSTSQFIQRNMSNQIKEITETTERLSSGKRVNRDMPTGISGLGSRHFPIMVEPGETIIPKTQNMLPTAGSGITLNIQGDIVTNDAEDFAQRISDVLPQALRAQNDMGGI